MSFFHSLLSSGIGLYNLLPLMDVWYDGTIEGSLLKDKSDNNRDGDILTNLVTDPGSELGSTLVYASGQAPTINTSYTGDFHSGTRCFRVQWDTIVGFSLVTSERFAVKLGETVNWSFWVKRITATNGIFYNVIQGDGVTTGTPGNPTFNAVTVGVWTLVSGSFVVTKAGGLARITFAPSAAGVSTEFRIDDMSITITGETNNCFRLPVDATLASRDTNNIFYTTASIPKTIRANCTYGAWKNDKIYCGGDFSYIFCNANPTILQDYILASQFEDLDQVFDTCPMVVTVKNSGGDYTTIQAAINGAASTGTNLHRLRVDVYDDQSVSTIAGYTALIGSNNGYIVINKQFIYISSVNGAIINITATKENTASDINMGKTEVFSPLYSCGLRGLHATKRNGGYLVHQHFTSSIDTEVIYKDCNFTDLGSQNLIDYRIANALPYNGISNGGAAFAGGLVDGFRMKINNCLFSGIKGLTWHDQDVDTANGAKVFMRDCTYISDSTIYDPISNPNLTIHESILITSINGAAQSYVFNEKPTMNSNVIQAGSPQTITYEQLT